MKNKVLSKLTIILFTLALASCASENVNPTDDSVLTVQSTNIKYDSATISWNSLNGSGTLLYNIYLNGILEAELIPNLNYTFINLKENTTYTGKVEAVDNTEVIKFSNFEFTTKESTNTDVAPSSFNTTVKHLGHVSTTIQWTASTVTNNANITYSVFIGNQLIASNLSDLELYIPNLTANKTYNGYVRAFNGNAFTDSNFNFTTVPSKVFNGRVILETQQEVDDFASNHYTEITDWLIIGYTNITSDIVDLEGLQSLVAVQGSLFVSSNPVLESTHGLQNISNDLNAIAIVDNLILNDLSGFSGINKLLDYINIVNNPEITTLDAFSGMTNGVTAVNVELTNNDKLIDIDGLSQLDLFSVYIRDHELLDNIDLINSSDSNTLGQLYIFNNKNLNDFSPLSNITLIKGSLTIGYSNITNLDNLSNLTRTFGDLNIWYNGMLTDLCGLQTIVQSNMIGGLYNVHDNAYNPTFQEINDGSCSSN
ncbi:hypothetical protein WJN01_10615 [Flavobacteriaceae bacterium SZ-1-7]|uniref:hypothetical protein n=1 Tax=Tamlana sedimenti TaxID=3134126 RepID=UPI0031285424